MIIFFLGELDAAMISVVEYLKYGRNCVLVPGLSISCSGPCGSVFLKTDKPLNAVKRIVISPESRSSNFYASVLFPECNEWLEGGDGDGEIVIGDNALKIGAENCHDLSQLWSEKNQLPTVFAVMVARNSDVAHDLEKILLPRIKENLENMLSSYPNLGCYLSYLQNLDYRLTHTHFCTLSLLRQHFEHNKFSAQDYVEGFLGGLKGKSLIDGYDDLFLNFALEFKDCSRTWYVDVENCCVTKISLEKHDVNFSYQVDSRTFADISCGKLSPAQAFYEGKTKITGDLFGGMKFATILENFFEKYPFILKSL